MGYRLGVDLGTTYTAAALNIDGRVEMLSLGNRATQIASVLYVKEDGTMLVGEPAEYRGAADPTRLAREFKRRIGGVVPHIIGGAPYSPQALMARVLSWTVEAASRQQGEPPEHVCVTYPANWGPFKQEILDQVIKIAGLRGASTCTEPEAAAIAYASRDRVPDGARVAVYDLGGGTFDAAVLVREGPGFRLIGRPDGVEHLGGIDFDAAVFQHALDALGPPVQQLDESDPTTLLSLSRLRRDCVAAKEALSSDDETVIPVALPGISTSIPLTRLEFEEMVRPSIGESVSAMHRALATAGVTPDELHAIIMVGGSSRIPLVASELTAAFGRPLAVDNHPKHDVALGAAIRAMAGAQAHAAVTAPPGPGAWPQPVPAGGTGGSGPFPGGVGGPGDGPDPHRGEQSNPRQPVPAQHNQAQHNQAQHHQAQHNPAQPGLVQHFPGGYGAAQYGPGQQIPGQYGPDQHQPNRYGPDQPARPDPRFGRPPAGSAPPGRPAAAPRPTPAGGRRWVIIGAIGAVVVLAAVLGVWFLIPRASDPGLPVTPTSTGTPTSTAAPTPTDVEPTLPVSPQPLANDVIVWPQRLADGNWEIATLTVEGVAGPPLIVSPEEDTVPLISPDRRTVLYLHATSPGIREVRVMGADGSGDRPLFDPVPDGCTNVTRPAFGDRPSPQMVLPCVDQATGDVSLKLVTLDGTVVRELDRGWLSDPALTPDGTSVVYWQDNAGRGEGGALYQVPLDGSSPPVAIAPGGSIRNNDPAMSPRDGLVAITRAGQGIWTVGLDPGHRLTRLTSDPTDQDPTWSPDGSQLAFKRQDQIWVMNADGSGVRRISPLGQVGTAPAWSPR